MGRNPLGLDALDLSGAGRAALAEAAFLVLGQGAVAADVAVLAADDDVDSVLGVAEVADLAHGRSVYPGAAAWLELVLAAVVEAEGDPAAVAEVELLLLLVVVATGLVGGRDHDRVDAEGVDPEDLADLAKAVTLAHLGEVRDGVAVAFRGWLRCL